MTSREAPNPSHVMLELRHAFDDENVVVKNLMLRKAYDCIERLLDVAQAARPRWRHKKRGTEYTEIGRGKLQTMDAGGRVTHSALSAGGKVPMSKLPCARCGGEGKLYDSKYGGNDPDVWCTGPCPVCEGSGSQECEAQGCKEWAVAFNDDGEALCADCMQEWIAETYALDENRRQTLPHSRAQIAEAPVFRVGQKVVCNASTQSGDGPT